MLPQAIMASSEMLGSLSDDSGNYWTAAGHSAAAAPMLLLMVVWIAGL